MSSMFYAVDIDLELKNCVLVLRSAYNLKSGVVDVSSRYSVSPTTSSYIQESMFIFEAACV